VDDASEDFSAAPRFSRIPQGQQSLRSPEDRGPSEMSVNANWISDKYAIYATVDTELIVGVPKSPAS